MRILILVVLPVLIALFILFQALQTVVDNEYQALNAILLNQTVSTVNANRIHLETLAKAIEENSPLISFLNKKYTPSVDFETYDQLISESIKGYAHSSPSVSIHIFMTKKSESSSSPK